MEVPPSPISRPPEGQALIHLLLADSQVFKAASEHAREHGVSLETAFQKVKRYAEEIVPNPNIYLYFRLGRWLGKFLVRTLFRVRLGFSDEAGYRSIASRASLVYIMNHRSNMDYALLGYLSLKRTALSFAVGEWARVWPLRSLVKGMGAFFIRRGSENPLYRAVLARYVQIAAEFGVVQAIYPEGRLSRDGGLAEPKIGLLDYLLRSFAPGQDRDLVFIPVAVNYDRVLEDRTLLQSTGLAPARKSRFQVALTTLSFLKRNLWLMVRGGWHRFGYAVLNFGTPVSLREYASVRGLDFRKQPKEARIEKVQDLARDLMNAVKNIIPAVPVALVSTIFLENPAEALSPQEVQARTYRLIERLEAKGARVYVPRRDRSYAAKVGLRMLALRHLIVKADGRLRVVPEEQALLRFYANSIAHWLT